MNYIFLVILIVWMIISYKKAGAFTCLSDTAYTVGRFPFALFCIIEAILSFFFLLPFVSETWNFFVFLGSLFLMGVGVTQYKDDLVKYRIHYVCAVMVMLCVALIYIVEGFYIWLILPLICLVSKKYWLLILEIVTFLLAFIFPLL